MRGFFVVVVFFFNNSNQMKFGLHNSSGNANERCQLWLKCNETEKKPHGVDFILPGDGDKKKKRREKIKEI